MRKQKILPLALFFGVLAFVFFVFSGSFLKPIADGLSFVVLPAQRGASGLVVSALAQSSSENEEGLDDAKTRVISAKERKEMQALRDQFNVSEPNPVRLLPARIVGFTGYIPGVSQPVSVTIDQGSANGVKPGQVVVYKDNLVGRVEKVTPVFSSVMLLNNDNLSFTAETIDGEASGVIYGGKDGIVFDNVVLSEKISPKDIVVTKGDLTADGIGFPPDLVVGEIKEIDKRQSDLFQTAVVESLLDVSSLTTVFVWGD